MELTIYAAWLNEVFSLFDSFVLGLHHELAVAYGSTVGPIADALGAAGHYGLAFGIFAVILLFFRQTRMAGVAILVSMAIAGGLSEFVIKDVVARPRPFEASETFNAWWQFVGSPDAHSSSFPSGHVAGATAAMIALAYAARRWWVSLLGVLMILVMAVSRMYLMVHYPSDVLGGFILGFFCGIIGYAITQGIWRLMGKHPDQIAEAKAAASRHGMAGAGAGQPMPIPADGSGYGYGYSAGAAGAASPAAAPGAGARGTNLQRTGPLAGGAIGEDADRFIGGYEPRGFEPAGSRRGSAPAGATGAIPTGRPAGSPGAPGASAAPAQRSTGSPVPQTTASGMPVSASTTESAVGMRAQSPVQEILDTDDIIYAKETTSTGYKTPANPLFKNQGANAAGVAGTAGAAGAQASGAQGTAGAVDRDGATGSMPRVNQNRPTPGAYSAAVEKPDTDGSLTLEDFRNK